MLDFINWHEVIFLLVYGIGLVEFSRWRDKRRQKKRHTRFLRMVQLDFPEATIKFAAVERSDQEAIEKISQQLGIFVAERAKMEEWPWHS